MLGKRGVSSNNFFLYNNKNYIIIKTIPETSQVVMGKFPVQVFINLV